MENLDNMEKSGEWKKTLLESGKSKGNSFPANLRCLNFERFPDLSNTFTLGHGKVEEFS